MKSCTWPEVPYVAKVINTGKELGGNEPKESGSYISLFGLP